MASHRETSGLNFLAALQQETMPTEHRWSWPWLGCWLTISFVQLAHFFSPVLILTAYVHEHARHDENERRRDRARDMRGPPALVLPITACKILAACSYSQDSLVE